MDQFPIYQFPVYQSLTLPSDLDRLLPTERQQISVLENIDEATGGDGVFDDEANALLPGCVVVGPVGPGALTLNVAHFSTTESDTSKYVHIKLPFDNSDTYRWHVRVIGVALNSTAAEIVDLTYIGRILSAAAAPSQTATLDPTGALAPTQYKGSDDHVYLRFKPSNIKNLDLVVHSLHVTADGDTLLPGDITISTSTSATL